MADDLSAFGRKLDQMAASISGEALRRTLNRVGTQGKKDINTAVSGTLGDQSMSNWRRGRPIQINGRYNVKSATVVELLPTKRAAGPMRVLEQGRQAGMSKGTKKRAPRPVSASRGKGTWTDATKAMEKSLPKAAAAAVHESLSKIFGR